MMALDHNAVVVRPLRYYHGGQLGPGTGVVELANSESDQSGPLL
jgi:hypothetical protein